MGNRKRRYPLKQDAFTTTGYNDQCKPCPTPECRGRVNPTSNANVAQCDRCGERFNWAHVK